MSQSDYCRQPCPQCPWRKDVPVGRFPPERYVALAKTAYDQSFTVFQCHKTSDGRPLYCAGFLLRGATHNLSARMAWGRGIIDMYKVSDGGHELFDNYREMAEANGVDPEDHVLRECR